MTPKGRDKNVAETVDVDKSMSKSTKLSSLRERNVLLLIHTSTTLARQMIEGILEYANTHGLWLCAIEPWGYHEKLSISAGWSGHGIIARINSPLLAEEILATGLPAVNLSWHNYGSGIVRCLANQSKAGSMAVEYFMGLGFENFAYCGPIYRQTGYQDKIEQSYTKALQNKGYSSSVYVPSPFDMNPEKWRERLEAMAKWVTGLPKPVAIYAWNAIRARQVTEACRYASIHVPEEVAVLGGDYDETISNTSSPPLSSVDLSSKKIGYFAAELLDQQMNGEPMTKDEILIDPEGIVTRQSTDTIAIKDPMLAQALSYIRRNVTSGIDVSDVLKNFPLSRRMLETKFNNILGRSPAAEIRATRLKRAKHLLRDTSHPISNIAWACGYRNENAMLATFNRVLNVTPSEYRSNSQKR
ncbi:MAG: DNA-binding transcriptional regulator [Gammaproteobacteria bacterium]|nr:DNA-binding transcriptional regulator [Gammaproteobacteria bacterium]